MNCGESRQVRPSFGSWVLYGLGCEAQNLPGYVALCPGGQPIQEAQNWTSAFLPAIYQGSYLDTRHTSPERLIGQLRPANPMTAQAKQMALLEQLEEMNSPNDRVAEQRLKTWNWPFECRWKRPRLWTFPRRVPVLGGFMERGSKRGKWCWQGGWSNEVFVLFRCFTDRANHGIVMTIWNPIIVAFP